MTKRSCSLGCIFFLMSLGPAAFGESEVSCPKDQYRVRSHPRRAYYRADGTYFRATRVSESCHEKRKGHDFWNERLKRGFPPKGPHKVEKVANWTEEERERVMEALSEIPEVLWDEGITGIYRLKRAKDYPNPSSHGGSTIVLYDNAFGEDRLLARLLAHEFAHHRYEKLENGDAGTSYRRATGWRLELEDGVYYWTGRKQGYVEGDGASGPAEDFANNVDCFLFDPERLRRTSPGAYEWIKKQFGDKFKIKRNTP